MPVFYKGTSAGTVCVSKDILGPALSGSLWVVQGPGINSSVHTSVLGFLQSHDKFFSYTVVQSCYRWELTLLVPQPVRASNMLVLKKSVFSNQFYNSSVGLLFKCILLSELLHSSM